MSLPRDASFQAFCLDLDFDMEYSKDGPPTFGLIYFNFGEYDREELLIKQKKIL